MRAGAFAPGPVSSKNWSGTGESDRAGPADDRVRRRAARHGSNPRGQLGAGSAPAMAAGQLGAGSAPAIAGGQLGAGSAPLGFCEGLTTVLPPRGPAPATAPPRVCGQRPLSALTALSTGVAHSRARRRLCARAGQFKELVRNRRVGQGGPGRERVRRRAARHGSNPRGQFGAGSAAAMAAGQLGAGSAPAMAGGQLGAGSAAARLLRGPDDRPAAARTGAGDGSASRLWTTPALGAHGALDGRCPQPCAPAPLRQGRSVQKNWSGSGESDRAGPADNRSDAGLLVTAAIPGHGSELARLRRWPEDGSGDGRTTAPPPRGPAPATAPPRVRGQRPLSALTARSTGVAHSRAR